MKAQTVKLFKSASWIKTFESDRKTAIKDAIEFINSRVALGNAGHGNRFTWRAADESGFTIAVHAGGYAYCAHKWNAARG